MVARYIASFVALVTLLPVVAALYISFLVGDSFGLQWYAQLLGGSKYIDALMLGIMLSLVSATLSTFVGWYGAHNEFIRDKKYAELMILLAFIPCLLPTMILGFALKNYMTIVGMPSGFLAIVIGHTAFCAPISFAVMRTAYDGIQMSQYHAAKNMGAGCIKAFKIGVLPALVPAVISSIVLAFVISWSESSIAWYVGGMDHTLSVEIMSQMKSRISRELHASTILSLFVSLALFIMATRALANTIFGEKDGT